MSEYSERNRKYYLANRERLLVLSNEWNATNPERRKAIAAARLAADPEGRRAAVRSWHADNHERRREYLRTWRASNPGRARAHNMNRRGRVKSRFVEWVEPDAVFVRDGGICQICDTFIGDQKWHIDHRIPLARGGEHSYANCQLAHAFCNLSKHDKVLA